MNFIKTPLHECELLKNQNFTSVLWLEDDWYFIDNSPRGYGHAIKYCPYCGKNLSEIRKKEGE